MEKRAPAARRVLGPDASADRIQQPARDRQAHAGAGRCLLRRAAAIETLEQLIDFGRDRVPARDRSPSRRCLRRAARASTTMSRSARRVSRRIFEQVRQRHRREPRVDVDDMFGIRVNTQRVPVDRVPHVRECRVDDVSRRHPFTLASESAAASIRAMSSRSFEQPREPTSSATAASACARRPSIRQVASQTFDSHRGSPSAAS